MVEFGCMAYMPSMRYLVLVQKVVAIEQDIVERIVYGVCPSGPALLGTFCKLAGLHSSLQRYGQLEQLQG